MTHEGITMSQLDVNNKKPCNHVGDAHWNTKDCFPRGPDAVLFYDQPVRRFKDWRSPRGVNKGVKESRVGRSEIWKEKSVTPQKRAFGAIPMSAS